MAKLVRVRHYAKTTATPRYFYLNVDCVVRLEFVAGGNPASSKYPDQWDALLANGVAHHVTAEDAQRIANAMGWTEALSPA